MTKPTKAGRYELRGPEGERITGHIQRIVAVYSVSEYVVHEDGGEYVEYSGQAHYVDEESEEMGREIGREYGEAIREPLYQGENGMEWTESDLTYVLVEE